MIEQALYEHLKSQDALSPYLTRYNGELAVFNQEAPADTDELWADGPQYGRIVFAVDLNGDPERDVSAMLSVDIMCKEGEQFPEDIEPIARELIDGYFFSQGTCTMAAQWKNSSYFTQPTDHVNGCTLTFDLLAFPLITTGDPDVIRRFNAWSAEIEGLHVINHDDLPATAWKPSGDESAIYWYLANDRPAGWIPDTYQTIWRTAIVKGHIFTTDTNTATALARNLIARLYAEKRLKKQGESPIMVNQKNTADYGSDPLRTGQVTVEATYAIIVHIEADRNLKNINF